MSKEPDLIDTFDVHSKRVLENRERIGRRWHGLDDEALARFVVADPDAQARFDAEFEKAFAQMLANAHFVVNADAMTLGKLRQKLGNEKFEKLFAACVTMLAKSR